MSVGGVLRIGSSVGAIVSVNVGVSVITDSEVGVKVSFGRLVGVLVDSRMAGTVATCTTGGQELQNKCKKRKRIAMCFIDVSSSGEVSC